MMYDSSYVCASSYHAYESYVKYSYSTTSRVLVASCRLTGRVSILCILHTCVVCIRLVIYLPALARSMASRR